MLDIWTIAPSKWGVKIESHTKTLNARSKEWRYSNHDGRLSFSATRMMQDQTAFEMEERFKSNALGKWWVPMFDQMDVQDSIPSGTDTFTVSPHHRYVVGGDVVVSNGMFGEHNTVQSITGDQLVLAAPISDTYTRSMCSGRPYVSPAARCVSTGLKRDISYDNTVITIGFVAIETMDSPSPTYDQYGGLSVVPNGAHKLDGFGGGITQRHAVLDDGFGNYEVAAVETYQRERNLIRFDVRTKDIAARVYDWILSQHGKDVPFWLPTWRQDLTIAASAGIGDSVISVSNTVTDTLSIVGQDLMIWDGDARIYAKVTNAALSGGNIVLSITPNLPTAISANAKISKLKKMRLDSNEIDIDFVPAGPMVTEISVVEVVE